MFSENYIIEIDKKDPLTVRIKPKNGNFIIDKIIEDVDLLIDKLEVEKIKKGVKLVKSVRYMSEEYIEKVKVLEEKQQRYKHKITIDGKNEIYVV